MNYKTYKRITKEYIIKISNFINKQKKFLLIFIQSGRILLGG